jgi:hypothetical protein
MNGCTIICGSTASTVSQHTVIHEDAVLQMCNADVQDLRQVPYCQQPCSHVRPQMHACVLHTNQDAGHG